MTTAGATFRSIPRHVPLTLALMLVAVDSALAQSTAPPPSPPPAMSTDTWRGPYVGGFIGAMLQNGDPDEVVEFDTNLDEDFDDTVRTLAGVDAFIGRCAGLATSPVATNNCDEDEDGLVLGGRVGYDWSSWQGLVVGVVGDLSFPEATDSVTAFSSTPAFYGFTRELNSLAGLRVRIGGGNDRWLLYGTTGVAFGWIEHSFVTSNTVNTFTRVNRDDDDDDDDDGSRDGAWGYQLGGGFEYRANDRLSLTAEYLFTGLDDRNDGVVRASGPAPVGNPFLIVSAQGTDLRRADWFGVHALTVGVNFRF